MSNFIVKDSALLNASASEVWKALTDPEITRRYFFHARIESSWTAGSPIVFRSKLLGALTFTLRGTITEIVPQRILAYRLDHHRFFGTPKSGEFSTVRIRLEAAGPDQTRISVSDDVGGTPGAEKRYARSVKGWKKILAGLATVVRGS